jgi:hypothetical protein
VPNACFNQCTNVKFRRCRLKAKKKKTERESERETLVTLYNDGNTRMIIYFFRNQSFKTTRLYNFKLVILRMHRSLAKEDRLTEMPNLMVPC